MIDIARRLGMTAPALYWYFRSKEEILVASLEREFYGMCRDLVASAGGKRGRSAEVAPIAFAIIGMVEHLISWFRPSGAMSVKQVATLYADLAVAMATASAAGEKAPRKAGV